MLNIDGSFVKNPSKGGARTIIRIKLWAIRNGLSLAEQLNITRIEVESDVDIVVKTISNAKANDIFLSTIVNDYRSHMSKFTSTLLKQTCQEGNQTADRLAQLGSSFQQDNYNTFYSRNLLFICKEPLTCIEALLKSNAYGLSMLRAKGIVVMVVMKGVGDEWVVVLIDSMVMSGMRVVMVMKMMNIRRLGKMEGSSWVQSSD
ncbi:hypothetical protein Godav_013985, partial [Gossypium davidsonii]|nr:hypothetical protein [Gossypium davidsonii]